MNTFTKTVYYRLGRNWAFRILSKWDDSVLAQGEAPKKRAAEEEAKKEHARIQEQRKTRHEQNDNRD